MCEVLKCYFSHRFKDGRVHFRHLGMKGLWINYFKMIFILVLPHHLPTQMRLEVEKEEHPRQSFASRFYRRVMLEDAIILTGPHLLWVELSSVPHPNRRGGVEKRSLLANHLTVYPKVASYSVGVKLTDHIYYKYSVTLNSLPYLL